LPDSSAAGATTTWVETPMMLLGKRERARLAPVAYDQGRGGGKRSGLDRRDDCLHRASIV
jgi:hypothetical protein